MAGAGGGAVLEPLVENLAGGAGHLVGEQTGVQAQPGA
jgi:hypothetical protein